MCGIVGIINHGRGYSVKAKDIITQMLLCDVLRGKDSTGVFKAKGKEVDWRKAACTPWEFFNLKNVDDFFNGLGDMPFIVGHNRWSTRGKVNNDNAHPFEVGKITLVHNGTLNSVYQMPDHDKFEVDSHLITHSINKIGIRETAPKMGGAYALVWFDSKSQRLNLVRNEDRPLYIQYSKDGMFLFGSELGLLRWIGGRNKLDLTDAEMLPPYRVYSFEQGNPVPEKFEIEKYRYAGGGGHAGYLQRGGVGRVWDGRLGRFVDEESENGECSGAYSGYVPPRFREEQQEASLANAEPLVQVETKSANQGAIVKLDEIRRQIEAVKRYTNGEFIYFSLNDFTETRQQGGFVPVIGDILQKDGSENKDYIVRGNYNGKPEDLWSNKNLLCGVISGMSTIKGGRVILNVKDISISQRRDPFYMTPDELAKFKGEASEEKEAPPQEESKPTVAQEVARVFASGEVCQKCGGVYGDGSLFTVFKSSKVQKLCRACLHEVDPKGNMQTQKSVPAVA